MQGDKKKCLGMLLFPGFRKHSSTTRDVVSKTRMCLLNSAALSVMRLTVSFDQICLLSFLIPL